MHEPHKQRIEHQCDARISEQHTKTERERERERERGRDRERATVCSALMPWWGVVRVRIRVLVTYMFPSSASWRILYL